jgi:Xaa-Pro aminopeptidase
MAASLIDDSTLENCLVRSGIKTPAHAIRALVAGVAAAPRPRPAHAWFELVGPTVDSALSDVLFALEDEARAMQAPTAWTRSRIDALRAELVRRGLGGFVIPRADEHQNEYVPAGAERLAYSTGFTGSAGSALVLLERAVVFVDGRYTLQAKQQLDAATFETASLTDEPPADWIGKNLPRGTRLGIDPWLHTVSDVERLEKACKKAGAELVWCESNPLDAVWSGRPPPPLGVVRPHPDEYAGRPADLKRHELGDALREKKHDAALITAPDAIAWLLNIRGGDVPHTPLPLSFAILHADGTVDLCVDDRKLLGAARTWLGAEVRRHAPDQLLPLIKDLGHAKLHVVVDPAGAPAAAVRALEKAGCTVEKDKDPCQLPKSKKNDIELAGVREAHRRDGAALTRFLAWLDRTTAERQVMEIEASDTLEAIRAEHPLFRDLSFDTISGAGAHGAIVHYRASPESDAPLPKNGLYLVDSGAQYPDGTTDVTRTVAIGTPTEEMRDRFTRVLKGHIAIARARFAKKTSGAQLDALARLALWEVGLDYEHGTGHGVGAYLAVHEGPQNMSRRNVQVPFEPGMIVSNEPGYYKAGEYGIRIENLVTVVTSSVPGGEKEMLAFETLTLAPIDRRLIEPALLSPEERLWLDTYHARVRDTLSPLVDAATRTFLAAATAPIGTRDGLV